MGCRPPSTALLSGLSALPAAAFLLFRVKDSSRIFEDAYITYRYAANIAAGHGAVFTPGDVPVEGFSSPLWTGALALTTALGLPTAATAVSASVVFGLLSLFFLAEIGRRLPTLRHGDSRDAGAGPNGLSWSRCLCLMVMPTLWISVGGSLPYWAATGMETTLALSLALWGLLLTPMGQDPGEGDRPRARPILFGTVLALLCLTRPEGALWTTLLLGIAWATSSRSPTTSSGLRLAAAVPFLIAAFYLAFRVHYFGATLPNTFYAKVAGDLPTRLWGGLEDISEWALRYGTLAGILALVHLWRHRNSQGVAWRLSLLLASQLAWVAWVGGDLFAYHRFLLPATAISAVCLGLALHLSRSLHLVARAAIAAGTLAWAATAPARRLPHSAVHPNTNPAAFVETVAEINRGYAEIGTFLRAKLPPDTLIALHAVGIIPATSNLPVLDLQGLTDAEVAHGGRWSPQGMRGHQRYATRYTLERAPDLYLFGFPTLRPAPETPQSLGHLPALPADRELLASPAFASRYALRATQVREGRWLSFYVRRGSVPDRVFPAAATGSANPPLRDR